MATYHGNLLRGFAAIKSGVISIKSIKNTMRHVKCSAIFQRHPIRDAKRNFGNILVHFVLLCIVLVFHLGEREGPLFV